MKTQLKYIISNLLLVGVAGTALLTTGCPELEETACTDNTDCSEGEVCLATADDAEEKECRAPENCSEAADGAAYCAEELMLTGDATASCKTEDDKHECVKDEVTPTTEHRFVQILDGSTEDGSCMSTVDGGAKDPGSDITHAKLLDNDGAVVGVGKLVVFHEGSDGTTSDFTNAAAVFSGDTPEGLEDNFCPKDPGNGDRFNDTSVVSLGCGGTLVLEFVDENDKDTVVPILDGYKVQVGEFGPFCSDSNGGNGSDSYDVYLCESQTSAPLTSDSTQEDVDGVCMTALTDTDQTTSGFSTSDVVIVSE